MSKKTSGANPSPVRSGAQESGADKGQVLQQKTGWEPPVADAPRTEKEQADAVAKRNAIVTDEAHSSAAGFNPWVGGNTGATPFGTPIDDDKQANDAAVARNKVVTEHGDENGLRGPVQRGVDTRIYDAISQLDKHNDTHWTDEGLPSTAAVEALAHELGRGDISVSREMINKAAPGFTRTVAPFQGPVTNLQEVDPKMENPSLDELMAGNDELQSMNDNLNDMYAQRDKLSDAIRRAEQRRDRVVTRLEQQARDNPKADFAETRRYLDQQQADRAAKSRANPPPARTYQPPRRSNR